MKNNFIQDESVSPYDTRCMKQFEILGQFFLLVYKIINTQWNDCNLEQLMDGNNVERSMMITFTM